MMTAENQKKYDEKLKRMRDALSLKEPDRVPIEITGGQFMVNYAGFTMADVITDTSMEKIKYAITKYLTDFDPDVVTDTSQYYFGEGPGFKLQGSKKMLVSGVDEPKIGSDSIQQHMEFPTLMDDEFDEFFNNRLAWQLNKQLPRMSSIMEPFANLKISPGFRNVSEIADIFSRPDFRSTIEAFWKISDFYKEYRPKAAAVNKELIELGYPSFSGGGAAVPFDKWSDEYRGTILSLMDLYDHEDEVMRYLEEYQEFQLNTIRKMNKDGTKNGKYVSFMLHKGVDGFMNGEQYRKFYWTHLKQLMETISDCGMIPVLFCEGKYNTRLDFLREAPKGSYCYFETVDMAEAKKKLSGIACVGGNFPTALLTYGTKQKVIDECKKLLDTCAPGGGYIFKCSAVLGSCKTENVEAMFQTVKDYGKYR
jgi:hypothetical protein